MIVFLHVLIAISSMAVGALLLLKPAQRLFRTQYALITATVASGSYLVIAGADLLHTCMTGLAYLAVVTAGLVYARRKASQRV